MPDILNIIDNLFILGLIVASFVAGRKISDSYNSQIINEFQYQLRLSAAKEGIGYVAPPVRKIVPIGQPFMDKLKENGRATQQISPDHRG